MSAKGAVAALTPEQRELLVRRLTRSRAGVAPIERLERRTGEFPLSPAQDRLWALDRLEPESSAYNLASAFRLRGPLHLPALRRALDVVVARHGALRTRFAAPEGTPVQVVVPRLRLPLPVIDLGRLPGGAKEAVVRELATGEANRPFRLDRLPLLRATLLRRGPNDSVLLFTVHHIVSDGWSMGILVREVIAVYESVVRVRPLLLPELSVQYADFAVWQRRRLEGEELSRQLEYWRRKLAGAPALLDLPLDRPRPTARTGRGRTRAFLFPWRGDGVRRLAREADVSMFTVLVALFLVQLHRYSGQGDLSLGTPVAGRSRSETEGLIGFFVNTLVLRADLTGEPTVRELLGRVRGTILDAQSNQDLPFSRLVEELQPERSLRHTPLFQVMLVFQNTPDGGSRVSDLAVEPVSFRVETTRFDLLLQLVETPRGLAGFFQYATDVLDSATIDRWTGHLRHLLEGACREPGRRIGDLPLWGPAERHQVLREWNDTARAFGSEARLLHELLAGPWRERPDAVAVVAREETLSFGELDRRSAHQARRLRATGVGPDSRVGVAMERSAELVVALVAVLRSGAAYVPLDPELPESRFRYLVEDAGVPVVLTHERMRGRLGLPAGVTVIGPRDDAPGGVETADPPSVAIDPEAPAYVIYTSGSTGRPKGAVNRHRAVVNRILWMQEAYGLEAADAVLQKTPYGFDVSVWELFWPLAVGARLVMAPPGFHRDPERLADLFRSHRITTTHFVPSMLEAFLEATGGTGCGSLARVICSGEALSGDLAARFAATGLEAELHNLYGPTEAAVDVSWWPCRPDARRPGVPIGRPIANLRLVVADRALQPAPLGVRGELLIGGEGLARGYHRRPGLSADRFVPDPFGTVPGGRVYHTGDLVRLLPDGAIDFLGRLDHQVKLRGVRIELGEIEAALRRHPAVREAVVVLREDRPGDPRLVAYLVVRAEAPPVPDLRGFLADRLPAAMVPAAFVRLDRLPQTTSGKVDRRALPVPSDEPRSGDAVAAPRSPIEEVLAALWRELLDLPEVGVDDDFFALGGHSLLGTRLLSRVRHALGADLDLPLRTLFEAPTLRAFAGRVEEALRASTSVPVPPLVAGPPAGSHPLSFAQERLWFLYRLGPESSAYNMPLAFRLAGDLDPAALRRALGEVVRRHEALRTRLVEEGESAVQVVDPPAPFPLPLVDLARLPASRCEAEARRLAAADGRRPFDLATGPLVRAALVRLEAGDHAALFNMHHVVSDGWSLGLLVRELAALYSAFREARPSPLEELRVQYRDFARWQRGWLRGEALEAHLAYWRERLAGLPPVLDLPTDRPRPTVQTFTGGTRGFRLPAELVRRLEALARDLGATTFMVLLSGFQALVQRLTGHSEFAVGIPVAGRDRVEVEELIGFFVNTLPNRADLSGDPRFDQLVGRVRDDVLGGHLHRDLPFEKLVEEVAPDRRLDRHPFFQVAFVVQNAPMERLELPGLDVRPLGVTRTAAKLDLSVSFADAGAGLLGSIEYNADLFDATTVQRMGRQLVVLLDASTRSPATRASALPLVSSGERHQVLVEWSRPPDDVTRGRRPAVRELEAMAERLPDAIAVVWGSEAWSYGRFDRWAEGLAVRLRGEGAGPERRIGICLERSPAAVAAIFAVLKAGAAYVPLDPELPAERLTLLVHDAAIDLVVTGAVDPPSLRDLAVRRLRIDPSSPEAASRDRSPEDPAWDPRELAYVIFTSGSTGVPNGVAIDQGALSQFAGTTRDVFRLRPGGSMSQFASLSWDASVLELFGALTSGARLCIVPPEVRLSGADLGGWLERERVGTAVMTPTVLAGVPDVDLPALGMVGVGGERCRAELVDRWAGPRQILNSYGPTEATVYCAFHGCRPGAGGDPPIGRPVHGSRVYVADSSLRPVPPGTRGELCIGGVRLARGYFNRPGLTARRFVPSPFAASPGERLYRSGDLVRQLAEGSLDFLGRLDTQVKIRGHRIELGEIEHHLARHGDVRAAVVVAREHPALGRSLVAYVVTEPGHEVAAPALRAHLADRLPAYMVPAAYVPVTTLPTTRQGKIDYEALPEPWDEAATQAEGPGHRTPHQELVAGVFAEVLRLPEVPLDAGFFDLGGHSLLATQLTSRLRQTFGVDLALRTIFEHPTPRALAYRVEAALRGGASSIVPAIVPVPPGSDLPLSFAQQRLWLVDQLHPGSHAYNIPLVLEVEGDLDLPAVAATFGAVVERHHVLRTRFRSSGGRPVQVVDPPVRLPMPVVDLSGLAPPRRETEADRALGLEVRQPFDLGRSPLLRTLVLRLAPGHHAVSLTLHHIVGDGWSVGVLVREVSALYGAFAEGRPSPLPPLPIQYADFATWQREWLRDEVLEEHLGYWARRLGGDFAPLDLPMARPRPSFPSHAGGRLAFTLGAELTRGLRELCRSEGATLFMALLAALKTLLHRLTGRRDLMVGTEVAGRSHPDVESLIGFFVNLLVLRTDLGGDPSFRELVARVRETTLEAYAHQDLPFDRLVQEVAPERFGDRTDLLQVVLVLDNTPAEGLELTDLRVRSRAAGEPTAKFDLLLLMSETGEVLSGEWSFPVEIFDRAAVEELSRQLENVVAAVVSDPDIRLSRVGIQSSNEMEQSQMESKERREAKLQQFIGARPKAVKVSRDQLVRFEPSPAGGHLPLVVKPSGEAIDLVTWAGSHRDLVDEKLRDHGGVLFRGFDIDGIEGFEVLAETLSSELYGNYGDLPRQEVSGNVYTSTPYPHDKAILTHNESSQMHCWPLKQFFFCVTPSETGGETPLVDCRELYRRLDPDVRRRFETHGLLYVRNFTDELDVSWEEFFRTSDRSEVEAYCRDAGIEWEWTPRGLRTRKHAPAVARHPVTGDTVFFNQIQAHHVSCVDGEVRRSLLSLFSVEDLPRNVYYGDGTPIEDAVVAELVRLCDEIAVAFPWQRGDVVMVDNMLVAHGRRPFTGVRKINVAMGQMVSSDEVDWAGKGARN